MTNALNEDVRTDQDGPILALEPRPAGAPHAEVLRRLIVTRSGPDPGSDPAGFDAAAPDFGDPDALSAFSAPEPPSPDRAAAVALGRTADRLYGLPVFVESVEKDVTSPPELAELFPERALLAVVHGPAEPLGVVALCPSLIASLIEMQAIGRISSRPLRARKPTRTDASISAEFVNALLVELGRDLRGPELPDFAGFSYASFLDDPRPLLLMLDDAPLTRLTLRFRIGQGGQRDGTVILALPAQAQGLALPDLPAPFALAAAEPDLPAPPPSFAPDADDTTTLADLALQAPIGLSGILCRKTLSLRQLRNLVAGDLLSLPAGVLDGARLETSDGQLLAFGRLGEAEGMHAIRLRAPDQHAAPAEGARHIPSAHASDMAAADLPPDQGAEPFDLPEIDISLPDSFREEGPADEPETDEPFAPLPELGSFPTFG